MLDRWLKKREIRRDAVSKARERFVSFHEISQTVGWKAYQEILDKKIENLENKMHNNTDLTGEDLKRLQLALQVYREVQRIPNDLKDRAKGEIK